MTLTAAALDTALEGTRMPVTPETALATALAMALAVFFACASAERRKPSSTIAAPNSS
jgi:hypothetical protein